MGEKSDSGVWELVAVVKMQALRNKIMQASSLSNVQQEILKLYATELSEVDIHELKSQLAHYYASKAISQADKVWDEKAYTAEDMESWLNE